MVTVRTHHALMRLLKLIRAVFQKVNKAMFSDPMVMVTKEIEQIRIHVDQLQRHAEQLEREHRRDDRTTRNSVRAEVGYIRRNQVNLKAASEKRDGALMAQMSDMMKMLNQRQVQEHDMAMAAFQVKEVADRVSGMFTEFLMLVAEGDRRSMLQGKDQPRYAVTVY